MVSVETSLELDVTMKVGVAVFMSHCSNGILFYFVKQTEVIEPFFDSGISTLGVHKEPLAKAWRYDRYID